MHKRQLNVEYLTQIRDTIAAHPNRISTEGYTLIMHWDIAKRPDTIAEIAGNDHILLSPLGWALAVNQGISRYRIEQNIRPNGIVYQDGQNYIVLNISYHYLCEEVRNDLRITQLEFERLFWKSVWPKEYREMSVHDGALAIMTRAIEEGNVDFLEGGERT